MQSFSSADGVSASQRATSRPTRLVLGVAVMALVILLAVVGASAEHGTGAPQLRRGPASVVLSVLFTLAGLAGVGSLALLFWGLVTRNRRKPRRLGASAALPDPGRGGGLGYLRLPDRTVSARRPRATPSVPAGIGRKTAVQLTFRTSRDRYTPPLQLAPAEV